MRTIWLIFICQLYSTEVAESAKILALFPYPLKSHFIVFDALLLELANRGHHVTVYSPFPKETIVPNYQQVDTSQCFHIPIEMFNMEYTLKHLQELFSSISSLYYLIESHEQILQCQQMRELMKTTQTYDLMVTELFVSEALLPFGHLLQIPYIGFAAFPVLSWHSWMVGNIDNPSYISHSYNYYPLTAKSSTLWDRMYNTVVYLVAKYHSEVLWKPKTNEIIRRHFGSSTPEVDELGRNISFIFSFSHLSLTSPRPRVPAVIEIGGIQVPKASPLPKVKITKVLGQRR